MTIAIYQPGQVGSFSLYEAIRPKIPKVIHCHGWGLRGMSSSFDIAELSRKIELKNDHVDLIVPLRDPVDWAVSRFFFRFRKYTEAKLEETDQSPDNLVSLFVDSFDLNEQSDWYEENVVKSLDISLYDSPFPSAGYEIFERDLLRVLVIKSELDNSVKSETIGGFLDTEIEIGRTNTSESRFYADAYKNFKKKKLPKAFLKEMYKSKYAKHFYTK